MMYNQKKWWWVLVAYVLCVTLIASAWALMPKQNARTALMDTVVLKMGSVGSVVKQAQQKLKNWGYYKGNVDGVYGVQTENAVKSFQKKNKIRVDGMIGSVTASMIGISLKKNNPSPQQADIYLLSKLVHAEARGEPYEGKVAVAAVVLSRVKSPLFPNSISAVIYQPQAFTCVDDGQINLTPDDASLRAARDAINGWNPVSGALYYYNPQTATNKWIRGRKIICTIGKHVFCE